MLTLAVALGRVHTTRLLCSQLSLTRPPARAALGTASARAGPVMVLDAAVGVGAAAVLMVVLIATGAVVTRTMVTELVAMGLVTMGLVVTGLAGTGLVVVMVLGLGAVTAVGGTLPRCKMLTVPTRQPRGLSGPTP